jgi:hypothetical protein
VAGRIGRAHEVWDDAAGTGSPGRHSARRATGTSICRPRCSRACALIYAGRFADASDLLDEADALGHATGLAPHPAAQFTTLVLAAHRGHELPALEIAEATVKDAEARGEGRLLSVAGYAKAVLFNRIGSVMPKPRNSRAPLR